MLQTEEPVKIPYDIGAILQIQLQNYEGDITNEKVQKN